MLGNGKVLVTGGRTAGSFDKWGNNVGASYFRTSELYDPTTGKWANTGSLITGRYSHRAELLSNGKVIVVGGRINSDSDHALTPEIFDPATGSWSQTPVPPNASGGVGHKTILLGNGKLLAIWLVSVAPQTKAALYDSTTNTWSATGAMNTTVSSPTLTLLPSGKVLAAGGAISGSIGSTNAELYDPITGTWSTTGAMITGRYYHASTLLPNGKLLAVGGLSVNTSTELSSSELYDPATESWTQAATMKRDSNFSAALTLPNGKILFRYLYDNFYKAVLYNPQIGDFSLTAEMLKPRDIHTMTRLPNGNVLFAGGTIENLDSGSGTETNSCEIYKPLTSPAKVQVWVGSTTTSSLSNGREFDIETDSSDNELVVGSIVERHFTVYNDGTKNLVLGAIRIDGPSSAEYTASVPAATTLAPGAYSHFTVTFKPTSAHYPTLNTATIHIPSNDLDQSDFRVTFHGWVKRPGPEIQVQEEWTDFDKDPVILKDGKSTLRLGKVKQTKSASKRCDIFSEGTVPLENLSIRLDGKDSKDFAVTKLKKTKLGVGGDTSFRVTFKPTSKGLKTAAIHIKSNDANESPFDIKLTGLGTPP